ncbi:hypothetical protein BCR43DRAFT_483640 [Syncephalastrum racemosum]|uniref:EamA domain-containing protein n=1 Tax=Syncephalastrum racemosum TaxID=13706 RepID=A0A1X2HVH3_SYNRA|nr:hypothetical protein BCR43DRAFT_483640 [Syncephalastrum racemosum]
MASTSATGAIESSSKKSGNKRLPTSITIVNEATPLLTAGGAGARGIASSTSDGAITGGDPDYRILALSTDPMQRRKEMAGLGFLVLSALCFTVVSVLVKWVRLSVFELVLARGTVQLVLSLLVCVRPDFRRWIVFRAITGVLGLVLFFYSLRHLDLLEASVLLSLGPAFTAIVLSLLFDDPFSVSDMLRVFLCVVGVVLIAKPPPLFDCHSSEQRAFAIAYALLGAMLSAAAYVAVRKSKNTHFIVHTVYFGVASVVLCPLGLYLFHGDFLLFFERPRQDWLHLATVGMLSFVGQCLLNQGLRQAPVGLATLFRVNDIFLAFIFGALVFHERPDMDTILGSMLIVGMTTTLGIHRWHTTTAQAAMRKKASRERLHHHRQRQQQQQPQQQPQQTPASSTTS